MDKSDLHRVFDLEKRRFARTYPHCADATLSLVDFHRRSPRDCARCFTDDLDVQFHPDVVPALTYGQCVALVRHELAHCARPDLGEAATDSLAELVSGEPIYYGADDIQTLDVGVRPRPGYLPR